MNRFWIKLAQGISITVAIRFLLDLSPSTGILVTLVLLAASGWALIKPLPSIGLGSRLFATFIFLIPGLIMGMAALGAYDKDRRQYLTALRDSDPTAYLQEIKRTDPDLWQEELAILDPEEFAREQQRKREETRKERAAACGDSNATQAYIYTQFFVEQKLKSPTTAKFPSIHKDGVRSQAKGDCLFDIIAYVDAQNSFGAMMRTHYVAQIKRLPEQDSWRLIGIEFLN